MPRLPPQLCAVVLSECHWSLSSGKVGKDANPRARRPAGDTNVDGHALGWRAKGHDMDTVSASLGAAASAQSRLMQLALAGLLGIFVVGFLGFSHMDVVHNAGHDYRHSMAFPCH